MKRLFPIGILISALLVSTHAQSLPKTDKEVKRQIIEKLKTIEDIYISSLDFKERREAILLMDDVLKLLDGAILESPPSVEKQVLSNEGYIALLALVKKDINEERKIKTIQSIGKDGLILSSQLKGFLETFTFEHYKVQCMKALYKNVYDKANFGIVLDLLTSPSSRMEVIDYINK